jgi:hypothetical protein
MTTHVPTENGTLPVTATLPAQPAAVEPAVEPAADPGPAKPVIDHVHAHSVKCYWDFMECRWQCSDG